METDVQYWSQKLQRRVMRLLLQHDAPLFRNQFRLFTAQSTLPPIPLLQQYDRYIKLRVLSNELLDDILPRIRRQLSLKTTHKRLREEAPTRGDIDWLRTLEHSWDQDQIPGQAPLLFITRLRQRAMNTPENILTVAILLQLRQEIATNMQTNVEDEELTRPERLFFVSINERSERELAAPYARQLLTLAQQASIPTLIQQVTHTLKPSPSPYRDLIRWWQRFTQLRIGTTKDQHALSLKSVRQDEKVDAWLYELWIALECIHLLYQHEAVQSPDVVIATDLLQCTFTWRQRRFRLIYNRQLDTTTGYQLDWEHGPASRPDYTIEREDPLKVCHKGQLIWQEPPVILDAKYYLKGNDPANTHNPIKKMLGDMVLLGAYTGVLFFPRISEPQDDQQPTRIIQRKNLQYNSWGHTQHISLYHLDPSMPFEVMQRRFRAILDYATEQLPERPQPTCQGVWLNSTAPGTPKAQTENTVLCPKSHIGDTVFDLVNRHTDCLQNPLLCHVIGQFTTPPYITPPNSSTDDKYE
jgi:hypothetical protein